VLDIIKDVTVTLKLGSKRMSGMYGLALMINLLLAIGTVTGVAILIHHLRRKHRKAHADKL